MNRVLLQCKELMLVVADEKNKLMKRKDMKQIMKIYKKVRKDLLQKKKIINEIKEAVKCKVIKNSEYHLINDLH